MPNPIKGEVLIEISGDSFPLVFNYDAIAQIEAKHDASILDVVLDLSRVETLFGFLVAALGSKFTIEQLNDADLPPMIEVAELVRTAVQIAYFGDEEPEATPEADTKKKRADKAS